jgi:hypothetical protein
MYALPRNFTRTLLAFCALLTGACNTDYAHDPDQTDKLSKPVVIDFSMDDAEIRTEEGEVLTSIAPEELSMVEEVGASVDGLENLSANQNPQAGCWSCKGCQNNGNGTITCWGCRPLSPAVYCGQQ